ncbi:MAG: hypothetical protein JXR37_14775 [Kiritimatiellae bacterium]|nr:hypothetical protein [Kiritimatiellia bacterium]
MSPLTRAQQKRLVEQWKRAGVELARVRREELRRWKYDWTVVDALLDVGTRYARESSRSSGLVEWQRWMRKLAER